MKIVNAFLATLLLAVGSTSAGELYTMPIETSSSSYCTILNVGPTPIWTRIEYRGILGAIIKFKQQKDNPSEANSLALDPGVGYCAFFFDGSPKHVRAGIYTSHEGITHLATYAK